VLEPTAAELADVARAVRPLAPDRKLRKLASTAIEAVHFANIDGELALSYVWPTSAVLSASSMSGYAQAVAPARR
jgi:hypothetical protein